MTPWFYYVENNPVRAGIVKTPKEYPWSSAKGHIQRSGDVILSKESFIHDDIEDWMSYLKSGDDNHIVEDIRKKTRIGQPCGEETFMIRLEKKLGMKIRKRKPGRPRKVKISKGGKK